VRTVRAFADPHRVAPTIRDDAVNTQPIVSDVRAGAGTGVYRGSRRLITLLDNMYSMMLTRIDPLRGARPGDVGLEHLQCLWITASLYR